MVANHRLENALVRAEELIAVGNQSTALQLLHDAIVSRWFQHNLLTLDAIMLKFVELCVELRRGRLAKDGLHQYRNLSQNANMAGLEMVLTRFLDAAEARLETASNEAKDAAAVDGMEDLENAHEESLLMVWSGAGNGAGPADADGGERSSRTLIMPWLRFVWETYRIVLDICRHNAKLESLYSLVIERAFTFCQRYSRKAEFRRLCEILRHHLSIILKYPNQQNGVQLQNPESHALQLKLRFKQLDVATEMELWHEAFRSIEDIHGLFVLARKSAQPALVFIYYSRLATIFRMANKFLFLAATQCKLYALSKSSPSSPLGKHEHHHNTATDANMAVLALLATPLVNERDITNTMGGDEMEAKDTRLAMFLGLSKAPTRASVTKDLYQRNIFTEASEEIQELFSLLEDSKNSTTGSKLDMTRVIKLLASIEADEKYRIFAGPIYRNIVAMALKEASRRQKQITFKGLYEILSIESLACSRSFDLDAFLVEGSRSGNFHLRIDHQNELLIFLKPCFASAPSIETDDSSKSKFVELFGLLASFAPSSSLNNRTSSTVDYDSIIAANFDCLTLEHQQNLLRKGKIEKRREQLDELQQRREKEEARERALKLQAEKEAEKVRLVDEAVKRDQQRKEQEKEIIRKEQAVKREEEEQRKREALARRANIEKIIAVVKRFDHLERAYRQEELPLLKDDYERQKKIDCAAYEDRTTLIKERSKTQHAADILLKDRLAAMVDDYQSYTDKLAERRAIALDRERERLRAELEIAKKAFRNKILAQAAAAQRAEEEEEEEERERQERTDRNNGNAANASMAQAVSSGADEPVKYIPPSKRHLTPAQADDGNGTGSSPFGQRATTPSAAGGGGGSWRRQ